MSSILLSLDFFSIIFLLPLAGRCWQALESKVLIVRSENMDFMTLILIDGILSKGSSQKKLPNFGHCPNFLNLPPIRGGLDSKSLEIMKLSWPPHPLGKFGHLGNKCLAFKKAFILLRLKTVCLYRQVELLVYTSTLHFRPSCENVTMNHFF